MQELGERPRELVERGLPADVVVGARDGEDRGQDLEAFLRQEPLAARERGGPVDVRLRVPLAALAALVERAQLLDLARVRPGPTQIDGHVDVELAAQRGDPSLVELHHLEVAETAAMLCENLVHPS